MGKYPLPAEVLWGGGGEYDMKRGKKEENLKEKRRFKKCKIDV